MGFVVACDPVPEPILPRRRLAAWRETRQATCWLLVGGPGSGKTSSLHALVASFAQPSVWLTGRAHARSGLPQWLNIPEGSEPSVVVKALAQTLSKRYPAGASLIWDAVEQIFEERDSVALLELWLKHAPPNCRTFLASRFPLPFAVSRPIIQGRIKLLGPTDLWLTDEEVDDWLGPGPRHPGLEASLAGWPLGIASLASLVEHREPRALIHSLAQEEWLAHLPEAWRPWAIALMPLPVVSTESIAQVLPGSDPVRIMESFAAWGLLCGSGEVRPWHSLARRLFGHDLDSLEEGLLNWLCDQEPETAIAYFLDRKDLTRAVPLLRSQGYHLLDERIGPWLARFSTEERQSSLDLITLEAAYLHARGAFNEALARLTSGLDRLRSTSSSGQVFAAILELLYGLWTKEDFAAFRQVEAEAEALSHQAELADRILFWNLKAVIRFDSGAETEAERLTRQILDIPHFGQPAITFIQQLAAYNLGARQMSRGHFEAAIRQFQRAMSLAREFPHRQGVLFGTRLNLAACLLHLGRFQLGESQLRELESDSLQSEVPHRRAIFQTDMGHCHQQLGQGQQAESYLQEALSTLTTCGLESSVDAAGVLNELGILHRLRGEFSLASLRHDEALSIAQPSPPLVVNILLQQAVSRLLANEPDRARAILSEACDRLSQHPDAHLGAAAELLGAIAAWRGGDRARAAHELARALKSMADGGFYHLAIAHADLVADLWSMLRETGRGDMIAQFESWFPEAIARLRLSESSVPVAHPELEIRCFGPLEVFVRGHLIENWPRKRAKALLAALVIEPQGLSREELCERIFPETEEGTRLNLLTSSLRKLLEPALPPRQKSRYLQVLDQRLRFENQGVRVDYLEFEEGYMSGMRALDAGRWDEALEAFRHACDLYAGDLFDEPVLMPGFDLERHRCRLRVTRMLELSAERSFACGRFEDARALAERLLEIEPTHEGAHCRLMEIYRLFGQEALLRRQYRLCERLLRQELDLEPSEETKRLGMAPMP